MKNVIQQLMKSEYKSTAEQIKILRKFEKHCKKQANKKRKDNTYNTWDRNREDTYKSRQHLSKKARYSGLARQFLKGTPYGFVENSNRVNNEAREAEISRVLYEWGINHDVLDLVIWVSERDVTKEILNEA